MSSSTTWVDFIFNIVILHNSKYVITQVYSNAALPQTFKAVGEEVREICGK